MPCLEMKDGLPLLLRMLVLRIPFLAQSLTRAHSLHLSWKVYRSQQQFLGHTLGDD